MGSPRKGFVQYNAKVLKFGYTLNQTSRDINGAYPLFQRVQTLFSTYLGKGYCLLASSQPIEDHNKALFQFPLRPYPISDCKPANCSASTEVIKGLATLLRKLETRKFKQPSGFHQRFGMT